MAEIENPTANEGSAPLSIGSQLCTECGLCCTGALHDRAVLDEDEIPSASSLGLPICESGRLAFALPCPHLSGTVCSIYADRPRVCSRYKCQLLLDVEAGSLALEAAKATVRAAHSLADRARTLMPPGMGYPEARALVRDDHHPSTHSSEDLSRLKLALTLFSLYLDRNFRKETEGNLLIMEPVALRTSEMKAS